MTRRLITIALLLQLIALEASSFDLTGRAGMSLYLGGNEESAVHQAAAMLAEDYSLVAQAELQRAALHDACIVAGTVGRDATFDKFLSDNDIDVSDIRGRWEAFKLCVISADGFERLLVLGSDKRGTAYGLLQISKLLGVSPWIWWADVPPAPNRHISLPSDYCDRQEPSVQYRGIFINDEECFADWSSRTYEPNLPDGRKVGPKTYEQVFRLLLRLNANCIWVAMHPCTSPFYTVCGNKEMADRYGIVVATSHCEPMMRAATEWNEKTMGSLNYAANRDKILSYWEERVSEVGKYENIYTVGMRGVHDLPMQGASTMEEKRRIVEQAFADQHELLRKYVNPEVEKVPQVFVPYKEVLDIYNSGLSVPDDITLMWCDDNYGYLTRLSNAAEQKRSGGSGVYYHISYYGRPKGYTMICTTQPALIYSQMRRAYDANARKIWILNVGDIKPGEFDTELFLRMAWDIDSVNESNIPGIMQEWYSGIFGAAAGESLSRIMSEFYRLSTERKPELMGWNRIEEPAFARGLTPVTDTEFNPYEFGDEISARLRAHTALLDEIRAVKEQLPASLLPACEQLVEMPVAWAKSMNDKLLTAQKMRLYAGLALPVANEYAALSREAFASQNGVRTWFNKEVSQGKWDNMLAASSTWQKESLETEYSAAIAADSDGDDVVLWLEHDSAPLSYSGQMPLRVVGERTFLNLFTRNGRKASVSVVKCPKWLEITEEDTGLDQESRLNLALKSKPRRASGRCVLSINGREYSFTVTAEPADFVAVNTLNPVSGDACPIVGLGYSGNAVPVAPGEKNALIYRVRTERGGRVQLRVGMIPNHAIGSGDIRYAVSIDDAPRQVVSIKTDPIGRDLQWKDNVSRNQSITYTEFELESAGDHTIRIYALDPGIILDQMQLDFRSDRTFYGYPQ